MTYTVASVFLPQDGSSVDGLTVEAFKVSAWTGANTPPHLGDSPPVSPGPDATVTTSTDYGNHGAWELQLPTNEDYFVVVEYSSSYYWQRYNSPAWTDGVQTELDVTTSGTTGQLNADNLAVNSSATINGEPAWGLGLDPFDSEIQAIGTANSGSVSGGSVDLGAFIDHQHEGLGLSQEIVSGLAATRYVGATTGGMPGSPVSPNTYAAGDYAIDQTGVVWIYNGTDWVDASVGGQAATGTIVSFAGITAPGGWLACDGSAVSRSSYAALWSALSTTPFSGDVSNTSTTISGILTSVTDILQPGWFIEGTDIPSDTTITSVGSGSIVISQAASGTATVSLTAAPWGVGDGSTTFNVPDLRGRVVVGTGEGSDLTNRVLGAESGAETVMLNASESGTTSHSHGITDLEHAHAGWNDGNIVGNYGDQGSAYLVYTGFGYELASTTANQYTGLTGTQDASPESAADAHNNMQPFGVVTMIIKT